MKKFRLLTATTLLFLFSVGQIAPPVHARSPNEHAIAEKMTALIKDAITDGIKSYLKQEFLKFIGFDSTLKLGTSATLWRNSSRRFATEDWSPESMDCWKVWGISSQIWPLLGPSTCWKVARRRGRRDARHHRRDPDRQCV